MLLLGLRRSLHGQIARALEERFRGAMEGRPETLAHHFTEAGLLEKAVGYWCRAGRQSVAKSGFVEAITQLRTGLRLIADLPDTREREQRELEVQIALRAAGARSTNRSCERTGRGQGIRASRGSRGVRPSAQLDLGDRASGCDHSFLVLRGLWAADFVGGQPKAALDHANEFLSLAQSQPDSWVVATGYSLVGRVMITIGDYAAATSHLEHAVASYRPGEHRPFDPRLGADIGVTPAAAWALALRHRGYSDQARGAADEALRRARQLRHLHTLAYALLTIGLIEELANELVALSDEHRFAHDRRIHRSRRRGFSGARGEGKPER